VGAFKHRDTNADGDETRTRPTGDRGSQTVRVRPPTARLVVGPPKEIIAALLLLAVIVEVTGVTSASTRMRATAPSSRALAGGGPFVPGDVATTTTPPTPTTTTTTTTAATATTAAPRVGPPAPGTTDTVAPAAPPPAAVAASPPHTPAAPAPDVVTGALGVYSGAANPSGAADFARTTGAHLSVVEDYLPAASWNQIDGEGGSLDWMFSAWRDSGYRLVLGVPMFAPGGSLATGATGAYDAYFVTLAQTLVSSGQADAILRLGQEFTGNWNPWRVTDTVDAANYAEFYRQIVTSMRSVPGQAFRFIWEGAYPEAGSYPGAYTAAQAYPGDAYVDYIGNDTYDQSWDDSCGLPFDNTATAAQSQCVFTKDTLPALGAVALFAAAHGKPVVFPEWGLAIRGDGHGLGDDPTFIDDMASWMHSHDVALAIYFNFDVSGQVDAITDGNFDAALTAFRGAFG
jgi:hypothetical protein